MASDSGLGASSGSASDSKSTSNSSSKSSPSSPSKSSKSSNAVDLYSNCGVVWPFQFGKKKASDDDYASHCTSLAAREFEVQKSGGVVNLASVSSGSTFTCKSGYDLKLKDSGNTYVFKCCKDTTCTDVTL